MSGKIIVIGAKGRFGRHAVRAFADAGWQVRAFARHWDNVARATDDSAGNIERLSGDATDNAAVRAAAEGVDIILHAANPPYPQWQQMLPRLTDAILGAAKATGATVMIPGNVYNYGAGMPVVLREDTDHRPTTKKGGLRVTMEQQFKAATADGVRTIILRAGDFLEREKTGIWFDGFIAAKISRGKAVYPGPLDQAHAWAYLPDLARAMVALAEHRARFAAFEEFGFPGFTLTGEDLVKALEKAVNRPLKRRRFPWPLVQAFGLFSPMLREVAEMKYLWHVAHGIDGTKLSEALPDFQATPLAIAMADAVALQGRSSSRPASEPPKPAPTSLSTYAGRH